MILGMEIKDWESHEHTVLKDFSVGFNLICGQSDTGKTSIIRALRLVAHNEFDPKSVRLGATHCEVSVWTERGLVKVKRGEGVNEWEVSPKGGVTEVFSKIGTAVLPQAAEVIGLGTVTLGDIAIPANIMDQHETHFMLAGLGDKKATGSARAQIIDEISGLSGIEQVIKDVSLDKTRNGRQIGDLEKKAKDIEAGLHDEAELEEEQRVTDLAQADVDNWYECKEAADEIINHWVQWQKASVEVAASQRRLQILPDEKAASQELEKASEAHQKASDATDLSVRHQRSQSSVQSLGRTLSGLPDETMAKESLRDAAEKIKAQKDVDVFCDRIVEVMDRVDALEKEMNKCEEKLDLETQKRDTLLRSIKTCPLTLRPVTKECLKGMKFPVLSSEAVSRFEDALKEEET